VEIGQVRWSEISIRTGLCDSVSKTNSREGLLLKIKGEDTKRTAYGTLGVSRDTDKFPSDVVRMQKLSRIISTFNIFNFTVRQSCGAVTVIYMHKIGPY